LKEHRFSLNLPFSEEMVYRPRTGGAARAPFHLFAAHSIWNGAAIDQLIPGAHKITILREPVATFESYYVYAGYDKKHGDINEFAKLLSKG
jgi:hypothetical protein